MSGVTHTVGAHSIRNSSYHVVCGREVILGPDPAFEDSSPPQEVGALSLSLSSLNAEITGVVISTGTNTVEFMFWLGSVCNNQLPSSEAVRRTVTL